ncbi:hypothetical protein AT3G02677 [Arabidopsis thaliana]|uniref:Uncharacterized protein n=1 Tax=Arabidopsis thaliana TaxID=3702 RepID=A0A1I9LQ93_ARATH|nr:uncharacterized protein AT3G02677 [Arabidopsis thaliana]ANM64751.1 hypothetical protein AT3G02677 [Arabidopsis thaliana]|eukprot:NP_001326758.1 hypothetical protein AT3G02677 [Arabidopsis thaliana]
MQNLRPFVAKCYRGGRSIGNRQSRGFSSSSSPTKNEPSIWIKEVHSMEFWHLYVEKKISIYIPARTKGSIHEGGTRSWSRVGRSCSRNKGKSGNFSRS